MRAKRDECVIDGCQRERHVQGLCVFHDRRVKKGGHPDFTGKPPGRPLKGEHPTWAAIHKRLFRKRGAASSYSCVDCGGKAREWSYDGLDPDQLIDRARGWELAYSLELSHYVPRCSSCHRLLDIAIRRGADPAEMVKHMPEVVYMGPGKKPYMQLAIEDIS